VNAPLVHEISLLRAGTTLVSFIWPVQNPELIQQLAIRDITMMAIDCVPRISRAQLYGEHRRLPGCRRPMRLAASSPGR